VDANALGPISPAAGHLDLGTKVRAYIALTKPRIIELLLITTVPTMFVAAVRVPSARLVLLTLVGGTLAAGGANAMNMVYDRDIDAVMNRTKHRPLVTGEVTPLAATVFALLLELGAFVLFATTVNVLSGVLALSATAFYVLVYTMWLKRSSRQNIVIGGAAGAMPVLVGWSAVTDHLAWAPVVIFAIIFLWTPPHFWALAVRYRDDYASANVPMLPVVAELSSVVRQICCYTFALWACSIALVPIAHMGPLYLSVALVAGGTFFYKALSLRRDATPKAAMKMFGYSITYLTVLFFSMAADVFVRRLH
jgi:protoheme IX farnesyltransferase